MVLRVDFNKVIDDSLDILRPEASRRGVSMNVRKCGPSMIRGDHIHLQQVMINLTVNAMDAMSDCLPDRKKVEIRTLIRNGREMEISVSDTGPGIAEDRIEAIFDTFYPAFAG
jgi:C4-dicarboxylate-specific signal transduction histidine kinase